MMKKINLSSVNIFIVVGLLLFFTEGLTIYRWHDKAWLDEKKEVAFHLEQLAHSVLIRKYEQFYPEIGILPYKSTEVVFVRNFGDYLEVAIPDASQVARKTVKLPINSNYGVVEKNALISKGRNSLEGLDFKGNRVISGYVYDESDNIAIVAKTNYSEVYSEFNQRASSYGQYVLVLTLPWIGMMAWIFNIIKNREKRRREIRQKIIDNALVCLSKVVDYREPYTEKHQHRVMKISSILGQELGFSKQRQKILENSALLHDIGKLKIPIEILNRTSRLTDNEMALIKEHPIYGYELTKDLLIAGEPQIILQHHERLDGSGYPLGLDKEEILFEAKIIAVADVFDAMISNRPYRPKRTVEEVLAYLNAEKGQRYDAEVVDILNQLYDRKDKRLMAIILSDPL